jgi:hypothetical protein
VNTRDRGGLLLFFLYDLHGLLFLLRLPWALVRTVAALLPRTAVRSGDMLAFGSRDALFRPWYTKIAWSQRMFGRLGYVWNDGFGMSMNIRFYNNWLTFLLYSRLGLRAYTAIGWLLFLSLPLVLMGARVDWRMGAAAAVAIVGSPVLIGSLFHMGKPECPWWVLLGPMVFLAMTGHWVWAGAVFSVAALANFSVAFGAGLTLTGLAAVFWPDFSSLALLVAGMAPGLIKTAVRLLPSFRARWLGELAEEQGGELLPTRARLQVLYYVAVSGLSWTLACWGMADRWRFLAFGGVLAMIFIVGQTVIYLNDPQSFRLWHLAIFLAVLALHPTWLGIAGLVLFAYQRVRECGFRPPAPALSYSRLEAGWIADAGRAAWAMFQEYPLMKPVSKQTLLSPFMPLFGAIPNGSRVLMETRSASLSFEGYRGFLLICEEVLPERGIEMLPDEYVRVGGRRFFADRMAKFNLGGAEIPAVEIAKDVGAPLVLAYSRAFVDLLHQQGFTTVGELKYDAIPPWAAELLSLPKNDLVLLKTPEAAGQVSPPTPLRWAGADLTFDVEAGKSYVLRYAFHPQMRARQGDRHVPIRSVPASSGSDLQFMELQASEAGAVTVHFVRSLF